MKIALVGTGNVARANYLPYLAQCRDVTLSYVTRTRTKAEECAKDFGGRVAGTVAELLEDDPDAVLVLTHETQRKEATLALLDHPRPPRRLFFEKPLVARHGQAKVCEEDFFEGHDLLQRAAAAGTETAMVFNYRFFEQTVRARRIVAERDFGCLTQAALRVNYACWSHCIDLLHCFGGRAARMTAESGETVHHDAVDIAGCFRLQNGATGTILGTSGGTFDFSLYEIFLQFERGSLHFRDLDGPLDVFQHGERYQETYTLFGNRSRWDQYKDSFRQSLKAYLDSIRAGAPPPVPGLAGLEELQFEAALRRSAAQQRPVDVQAEFSI